MFPQPSDPKCSDDYILTLRDEWRQVFIIAAEVYITGALLYVILSAGKTQSWAAKGSKDSASLSTPKSSINEEEEVDGEEEKQPLLSDSQNCTRGSGYTITRYDDST